MISLAANKRLKPYVLIYHSMRDSFDRTVRSLRISVIQKCNFNCFNCHDEGQTTFRKEMAQDRLESIVETAADLVIKKLKTKYLEAIDNR